MAMRLFQGNLEQALNSQSPRLAWNTGDVFTDSSTTDIYIYDGSSWSKVGGTEQDRRFPNHLIQELL